MESILWKALRLEVSLTLRFPGHNVDDLVIDEITDRVYADASLKQSIKESVARNSEDILEI